MLNVFVVRILLGLYIFCYIVQLLGGGYCNHNDNKMDSSEPGGLMFQFKDVCADLGMKQTRVVIR